MNPYRVQLRRQPSECHIFDPDGKEMTNVVEVSALVTSAQKVVTVKLRLDDVDIEIEPEVIEQVAP